jgi:hypothetical protein
MAATADQAGRANLAEQEPEGQNAADDGAALVLALLDPDSFNLDARPFRFVQVTCARLEEADWTFAGRSETSKRTITATLNRSGMRKLRANWTYRIP